MRAQKASTPASLDTERGGGVGVEVELSTHKNLKNSGLHRRLVFGFGSQALNMIVTTGERILLVPLFLYAWGVPLYEDWLVLSAATGFVRLFDFGLEFHFGNAVRLSLAAGDRARFQRALSTGIASYLVIMCITLISAAGLAFALPTRDLFGLSTLTSADTAIIGWLMVTSRVLLLPRVLIKSVYTAHGEFSRGENMFTIFTLGQSATAAALLLIGTPPLFQILGTLLSMCVSCWAVMLLDQRRRYPEVSYRPILPDLREVRRIFKNGGLFAIPIWSELLLLNGPVLLIGLLARQQGAVIVFTVSRTLTGIARLLAIQLARNGGIEMARQIAQGDQKAAAKLHLSLGRTIGGFSGLACGMLVVAADPFIRLWTGGNVEPSFLIIFAFVAGALFAAPSQTNAMLLQLSNMPRPLAVSSLIQAILAVALTLALLPTFGALGAAVALGFADAIALGVMVSHSAMQRFRLPAWQFTKVAFGSQLVGFALGVAAAAVVLSAMPIGRLPDLARFAAIFSLLVSVPTFFLVLDKAQRRRALVLFLETVRRCFPAWTRV